MAEETIIAWTDRTANFWMGCAKVSEGCRHCYAETLTTNRMGLHVWGDSAPRQLAKGIWQHVRDWQRAAAPGDTPGNYGYALSDAPRPTATDVRVGRLAFTPHLVFTGSLMDWAEDRADLVDVRQRMWDVIRSSPHLWFQMLTKRPENIRHLLPPDWGPHGYENVWLCTTIEDNRVKVRADHLRQVPARVHFISYEPAIGPLDEVDLTGIEWVICGGESGPGYRPLDMRWARDVRDRCVRDGRAFFMKQGAGWRTEMYPFLVEEDGSRWAWKQYPGKLDPPVRIAEGSQMEKRR